VALASIFAYYDALRAIGGDKVDVRIVLPPGKSPHDYEASPSDKTNAMKAKLYVKNDLGLDDRFDKRVDGSRTKVLDISKAIPQGLILTSSEISLQEEGGGNGSATTNPHIWLDPAIQMAAAEKIRDALVEMDPADKETFEKNAKAYIESIRALDEEFKTEAAKFKTKEFIGFHSAYEYLARRYGLKQIASIEEVPDAGLSVAQAEKVIRLIQEKHIKYIAMETALVTNINIIKNRTGVQTITLQPLETYDDLQDTYVSLMRKNLEELKKALE
jgi:ABC-type Zn uptake system ZnuABC Zn-binding protein ZnuA